MPVSRKTRNKKTNSFGVRKKEQAEKERQDFEGRVLANDNPSYSLGSYDMMANMFATSTMKRKRKSNNGGL